MRRHRLSSPPTATSINSSKHHSRDRTGKTHRQETPDPDRSYSAAANTCLQPPFPGGLPASNRSQGQQSTQQRLAKFYGVRQTERGILFRAHYPHAEQVYLAGDFNGWNPARTPLARQQLDNVWQVVLPLQPGSYRYRLVVDNRWQRDPFNERVEANPFGELNSVVEVK